MSVLTICEIASSTLQSLFESDTRMTAVDKEIDEAEVDLNNDLQNIQEYPTTIS